MPECFVSMHAVHTEDVEIVLIFSVSWWGIIYISRKLIIRSLLNAQGSGACSLAPSLSESLLLMLNLTHAVCLYSCLLESPTVISSAHLVRFLITDNDGKPAQYLMLPHQMLQPRVSFWKSSSMTSFGSVSVVLWLCNAVSGQQGLCKVINTLGWYHQGIVVCFLWGPHNQSLGQISKGLMFRARWLWKVFRFLKMFSVLFDIYLFGKALM